ncbi:biliverdin-producing heme oxygenase [Enterovirga rhinocerotis]|uniref:Heme oxygenase n=1 Tax=Enterovirga rhinocerotis TaxID=1339210 RepID=A0A4R7BXE4_9HYPH|nr:biliverdin-producing heme oxygenase [Enterovirga rhinocerotis]TDR89892.1 heme oxygenase [Enterovirga rhinocerotis]
MSLHLRLKTETRAAHDSIEAAFDMQSGLVSREAYGGLLRSLHSFHAGYETAAQPYLEGTPFGTFPGRSLRLARDLAALGVEPGPEATSIVLVDLADALGAAYVIEGSTLGGLVIAREVEKRLGLDAETGNAFFSGEGKDTMRRWRAFCAALDERSDPAHDDRVIASADRTFAAMQAHLVARPLPIAA